jgi:hypothetical protein
MKEMVDIGSRFIGFRNEADSLRGKLLLHITLYMFFIFLVSLSLLSIQRRLRLAEERANVLEKKLEASEKARKKAEKEAAGVEDLRKRLHVAKNALSEKEAEITQREDDVIALFETQCPRFLSNTTFPFAALFTCVYMPSLY